MGGAPSKPGDPARRLEVIGAGYSRTGTVTMQLALEKILDGPALHGGTHLLSREDGELPAPHLPWLCDTHSSSSSSSGRSCC